MPLSGKPDWLVEENVPQLSDDLDRRISEAMRHTGLSPAIQAEVDEVIAAACKAIRKHYADENRRLVEDANLTH